MGVNGIYGLSGSGLDIESLVKMGMMSKQSQYDKMYQNQMWQTWMKEAYVDVYNQTREFKDAMSAFKLQSNMSAMKATSSDTSAVTATANGAAAAMSHKVTVSKVASNAYMLTADEEKIERQSTLKPNSNNLSDVLYKNVSTTDNGDGTYKYTLTLADGSTKTVNGSDTAISIDFRDRADRDDTYTLTYTYDDLIQEGKTLYDFASAVAKTGANIQGSYDSANDSFSLYNKTSGKDNIIGIVGNNADSVQLLNSLKLGVYDANAADPTNALSGPITFASEDTMATVKTATGAKTLAQSTSIKDVLGLKGTLTDAGSGQYTLNVTGKDGVNITVTDTLDNLKAAKAYGMTLSDGSKTAAVDFTFGELFNLDKTGNLQSTGTLSDLADKINQVSTANSMGITATYDEANDSFSMVNISGKAELAGATDDKIGAQMISALNLESSSSATFLQADNGTIGQSLGSLFGYTAQIKKASGENYQMDIMQGSTVIASYTGDISAYANKGNSVAANQTAVSFDVTDGDKTTTVELKFGDFINFEEITIGSVLYVNGDGVRSTTGWHALSFDDDLSNLADKINAASEADGNNVQASFDNTSGFTLYNLNGTASLTGSSISTLTTNLNLQDSPVSSSVVSKGISRVNANSTDSYLKDILGVTAVSSQQDASGKYTVTLKDSKGQETTYTGTRDELAAQEIFSMSIGDSNKSADISFTLSDIFDLSNLGTDKQLTTNRNTDLSTLKDRINTTANSEGIKVEATYDTATNKFTLSNPNGHANLNGNDALGSTLSSNLGLAQSATDVAQKYQTTAGSNAMVNIDGKNYDLDTNVKTVAGVTYTFNSPTEPGKTATVTVNQDTDTIVDNVKKFVEAYNTLLDSLNDKLSEERYSDYKPLTKEQEAEMTEEQIKKWNEKAKSGLLYHDANIRSIVSDMREALYTPVDAVDSKYNSLSAIGITTNTTKGHITLDEDKLRTALADDPDCVYQLFASDQDSSYISGTTSTNKLSSYEKKSDYRNTGVANRLYNLMGTHMSSLESYGGVSTSTDDQSYLGKLITNMQTRMDAFKTLMKSYESKLYDKYDAMEVALSKLGTQLSYITG